MKALFPEYYPPSAEDFKSLWDKGLVVLDTNVLLNLYKVPVSTRNEMLGVLEKVKTRLWIPHQVALEFQRNRLAVIATERKSIEEALSLTKDHTLKIEAQVSSLEIDKRGLEVNPHELLAKLKQVSGDLEAAISRVHEKQLDISAVDPIRQQLDELLDGKVGFGPQTQADLDLITGDGESRYADRIPPGYRDVDKEKNPTDATYVFSGIRYKRKFGDLILWKQLLNHVIEGKFESVLFITSDSKEDWWWRERGKTVGPQPELVSEITRNSDVKQFWMYTLRQFMEHASTYLSASVSEGSLEDIDELAARLVEVDHILPREIDSWLSVWSDHNNLPRKDPIESAVSKWLSGQGIVVDESVHEFPDIIAWANGSLSGYEIIRLRHSIQSEFLAKVEIELLKGGRELKAGRLAEFHIVLVLPNRGLFEFMFEEGFDEVYRQVKLLVNGCPGTSVVVGSVVGGVFTVIAKSP